MILSQDLDEVVGAIESTPALLRHRAKLIAISGIDASGKGYVAAGLADRLRLSGDVVAVIGIDGWLQLPNIRFSQADPAENFYRNAFRFDEMFERLIDPLVTQGTVDLIANFAEETAQTYRTEHYHFQEVDIVLMEGIFLFRRDMRSRYDLRIWVECSFEGALQRAIARGQEGLPPSETIAVFESIYFPAQRIHFERDDPKGCADLVFDNGSNQQSAFFTGSVPSNFAEYGYR